MLKASPMNPLGSAAGVFAGQVLALKLNVDFSRAGITKAGFGCLVVTAGTLHGYTVDQVLALANKGARRQHGGVAPRACRSPT